MRRAQALKEAEEEEGYHAPVSPRSTIRPKPNANSNMHKDWKLHPQPAERKERHERRHACRPSLSTHEELPRANNTQVPAHIIQPNNTRTTSPK